MVGGSGPGGKGPGGPGGVGGASGPGSGGVGGSGPGGKGPGGPGGVGGVSGPSPGTPGTAPGNPGAGTGTSPSTATPNQSIQAMQTARESFASPAEVNPTVLSLVESIDRQTISDDSQTARQSMMNETIAPPDISRVISMHTEDAMSKVADSRDDSVARSIAESTISNVIGFPIGIVADVAENSQTATAVNDSKVGLADSFGISPDSLGDVSGSDVGNTSIGISTDGVVGNPNAVANAIAGVATPSVDGPSPDGGPSLIQDEIKRSRQESPPSQNEAAPSIDSEFDFGIANVINYASYARDVFSII